MTSLDGATEGAPHPIRFRLDERPYSSFSKFFQRGVNSGVPAVRCKVRGSDSPRAAPYWRDMVEENKKIFLF